MCGIAGIIQKERNIREQEQLLRRMQCALERRGPDQEGIFCLDTCGLVHRRLAVIDVAQGKQPMQAAWNGITATIVYNGEIYNCPELRHQLQQEGAVFQTTCDTEVVLQAYLHWGKACVQKLNGIFAFAIWEAETKRLFLARDRIGVKPLFYAEVPDGLVFASELKALLLHPQVPHEIDATGIAELLLMGPGRTPGCGVFRTVRELKPAQSGGLDSSIISSVAGRVMQEKGLPLHTFSVDYKDNARYFQKSHFQPTSDPDYIRRMAEYLNCVHHWTVLDTPALAKALYAAVDARDLPGMVDVDSSLLLFCGAIKQQVTVALSGECADELFGGYPWYRDPDIRMTDGFPWAQSTAYRMSFLREEFAQQIDGAAYVYQAYRTTADHAPKLPDDSPLEARMREMMKLNLDWFMQTLLDRKDRMSMYQSLEVRVPFCDYRIAEYLYNVPWEFKDWNGYEKGLLREAMRDYLPPEVLWRKKSPYPKTHNPNYLEAVSQMLADVLADPKAPILQLVQREKLERLLTNPESIQWYGQLMTRPQIIAYFVQLNYWMQKYAVTLHL